LHIPTVISRHPLWDDHDEEADPNDDRLLDEARLTLTTSWLDARPLSVATMPGDSILPLLFSLTMFVFFIATIFQMMWLALAGLIATFLIGCFWMWPKPLKGELAVKGEL
jgi:hypothetical protein